MRSLWTCLAIAAVACGARAPAAAVEPTDAGGPVASVDAGLPLEDPTALFGNVPAPTPPVPDDATECSQGPHPVLDPQPDHPCSARAQDWSETYRYDPTGRLVYRQAVSSNPPSETVFQSDDSGDTRVETTITQGAVVDKWIIRLGNGRPAAGDHFADVTTHHTLDFASHDTWFYDASGRQIGLVRQFGPGSANIERDYFDARGRVYLIAYGNASGLSFGQELHSWFTNGSPAGVVSTSNYSSSSAESRWDACGNRTDQANVTSSGRGSTSTGWSWDASGRPSARVDRWVEALAPGFTANETYTLDASARVASSVIATTPPPWYGGPPIADQHVTYSYDAAGRMIAQDIDGEPRLRALFDDAGRLIASGVGAAAVRWTYDGCGR